MGGRHSFINLQVLPANVGTQGEGDRVPQEHNICLLHFLSWGGERGAAEGVGAGWGLLCWEGGIQGGHKVLQEERRALKELQVHSPGLYPSNSG